MTRPKKPFTEQELKSIEAAAGIGLTMKQIASLQGTTLRTLQRKLKRTTGGKEAVMGGRAKAFAQVAKTLFEMATSGREAGMTKFYLQTRGGNRWQERKSLEVGGKDGKPIEQAIKIIVEDYREDE